MNPIRTAVSIFRSGKIWQGYALYGDKTKVAIQSQGFVIQVEMTQREDGRPQATVQVCGNTIFNTEDHLLEAPEIADSSSVVIL